MSTKTRKRKGKARNNSPKRRQPRRAVLPSGVSAGRVGANACPCPVCSGGLFDPGEMIDAVTTDIDKFDDLLDAEVMAAMLLAAGAGLDQVFESALADGLIPQIQARATPGALAMLLALGAVAPGRGGAAAATAAGRLAARGLPAPRWAPQLAEPLRVAECTRAHDLDGGGAVLVCTFHRGKRSHGFVVTVDELDCGAALHVGLLGSNEVRAVVNSARAAASAAGKELVTDVLDPAEFRWHVEKALAARDFHDGPAIGLLDDEEPDDGSRDYGAMSALLRARMAVLPAPTRPLPPHGDGAGERLDALPNPATSQRLR